MKDVIIPTGSLITRSLESDKLTIHSPRRKKSGMIMFYQVISVLIMTCLALVAVNSITTDLMIIFYTLPLWPLAVFMFRLGKKAATLEQWLILKGNELTVRKKNFAYLKEWKIPFDCIKCIQTKQVGFFTRLKNMSYYLHRPEEEEGKIIYPIIDYKKKGHRTLTFFENATKQEREWIVNELQEITAGSAKPAA